MKARIAALIVAALLLVTPMTSHKIVDPPLKSVVVTGIDAHDGVIYRDGTSYYLAGTSYGCGFTWGVANTPWCGFDVYTASAPSGPWTLVRELFNRGFNSPFHNQTWQSLCGGTGGWGCFNPRMVKRPDGVWVLSFNAPGDLAKWNANGYYFMTCDGPAGPCGNGSVTGITVKPPLYICNAAEDFGITIDGAVAYIVCVARDRSVSIEKLDGTWTAGINVGATNLAGLTFVEGLGIYRDPDGTWIMTYGSNCAYCVGVGADYAYATSVTGPYTAPSATRRRISGTSCGGQPRTVVQLDGVMYQAMDTWYGPNNETNAAYVLGELRRTGQPLNVTPSGSPWRAPFFDFVCA